MVWGNPAAPAEEKPAPRASTLANFMPNDQQFPSLGEDSRLPNGSGSTTNNNHRIAQPASSVTDNVNHTKAHQQSTLGYYVTGSKKGGFPVVVEKRSHKKVTVIRNVVGDRDALLTGLKKRLGCGGIINKDGNIELQGERQSAVEKFLSEKDCLKAVSKVNKNLAAPPVNKKGVAEPTKIDKKIAAARGTSKIVLADEEHSSITDQAAKKMKPAEMKVHLKAAGLSTQGNKKELLARLMGHIIK